MSSIGITYRRNEQYTENSSPDIPRLFAEVDLSECGIKQKVKNLAIYYQKLEKPVGPVRVVYKTSIAGLALETGNLNRLEQVITETIKKLIRFQRLPEYFFQVNDNVYPIYQVKNELIARYPGGPVFSTEDIASLRVWLADHFKALHRIKNRREMSLLYLSSYDLQLYSPYCVMRTPDEEVPDIPVFPLITDDGINLIAPVSNTSLSVPYDNGKGIFTLFNQVADYLIGRGELVDRYEITIRKLSMMAWKKMEQQLTAQEMMFAYKREISGEIRKIKDPIFVESDRYLSARKNRLGNMVLYLAPDLSDLQHRIGTDLFSYGAISDPTIIKTVPVVV